jgi:SAM-dependent methyltransferase
MRTSLTEWLCCPDCRGALDLSVTERDRDHVMSGSLVCQDCTAAFPITAGVPRMNRELAASRAVAEAFSYQWKLHHRGDLETDTLYGWTPQQDWQLLRRALDVTDEELVGRVVLDAGCGSARFTQQLGDHGVGAAIGVDIVDAVDDAFDACRHLSNVHIVQANIAAPPFRAQVFDYVWCRGVLHHTPDPAGGHRALANLVKPGGTLYVWVYAKRFNPFRLVKSAFDAMRITRLPLPALFAVCRVMAYPSLALLALYRAIRMLPGLRARSARQQRTVRRRGLREVQLTWFDALAPAFDSRHTEAEVVDWFARTGFERIVALEEPKIGVRGTAPATTASILSPSRSRDRPLGERD